MMVRQLSSHLINVELPNNELLIGDFTLKAEKGLSRPLKSSNDISQLLGEQQSYRFLLKQGELEISIQIYQNDRNHYRINCFSRFNGILGQLFSVNISTQYQEGAIFLTPKIVFSERVDGDSKLAVNHKKMKKIVFVDILRKMGFEISPTDEVYLGVFDVKSDSFLNTTCEKLINDLLVISLLKGHFMSNKGYQLEILPSFKLNNEIKVEESQVSSLFPEKITSKEKSRTIPDLVRFKVLERDRVCKLCGYGPPDGVKLHVDHIIPFSLGGTSNINNLQALCYRCNLGKGNRSSQKY